MKAAAPGHLVSTPPILLRARDAARLCGCGLSFWYQLDSTGQNPQPVILNSLKLWSYEHLRAWARHGCPARTSAEWQEILVKAHNVGCCGGVS